MTTERRAAVLSALVEGNSIASTCRMFGVNKITVLRLIADAGTFAQRYHDEKVHSLETKRVQVDEIWSFVHSKARNVKPENWGKGHGDAWTWVAMDADSKLVINWHVGGRDRDAAREFINDLADRLLDRIQLTSDGLSAYIDAVAESFGYGVDYAQLIKEYATDRQGFARYSPPVCISARAEPKFGNPALEHINTSYVERQNLSMRMGMRRFTRLTNGFSKKLDNHKHMIAIYYFHYNFIRKHLTIKTTPAIMAGLTDRAWTMVDFVELMEREEATVGGRITDYKISASKRRAC